MGIQKYLVCHECGQLLKRNRLNFKRIENGKTKEYSYHNICKKCEEKLEYQRHWDGEKLRCFICGRSLDPSEFDLHTGYSIRNHRDRRCKKCKRELNLLARENYSKTKKLYKIIQERVLGAKLRAKMKNIPFDITKEFILELWNKQNGLCAISKIPMTYEMDKGRIYTNLSIDRIELKKGYTKDNVQLVCMAVNQLKSDLDHDTIKYICKMITENYE